MPQEFQLQPSPRYNTSHTSNNTVIGDWTPVVTIGTPGDLSVAYTQQAGRYFRIDNYVTIWFAVVTSTFTHTTAAGWLMLTGLPFTPRQQLTQGGYSELVAGTMIFSLPNGVGTSAYTQVNPIIVPGETWLSFVVSGTFTAAVQHINAGLTYIPTGNNITLNGQISYFV